ncbi:BA71V-K205R [Elysia marginata]|uniref:BA71V-K205R n=1 Tax=Elysia marginata TaxID=1093978 RepID=A0AAV4H3A7_9GAST|nr:BA71V-K205R [Elysia marginata]
MSSPSEQNCNKHQRLVSSIVSSIMTEIVPHLEELKTTVAADHASFGVLLNTIMMRIEVLEKAITPSGGAPKRPPRGERKVGGGSPEGAAAAAEKNNEDFSQDKIKNAMLFCRRQWADSDEFRSRYLTKTIQDSFNLDDKVAKNPENSEARLLAEGSCFWRNHAAPQQKQEIREKYMRWKDERDRAQITSPLTTDNVITDDES